jgi:hypothetical protein
MRALVALALLGGAASAQELAPGYYAVSCGVLARGADRATAIGACQRAQRRERDLDHEGCNCARHGDVVRVLPNQPIEFYMAGDWSPGKTRDDAIAACLAEAQGHTNSQTAHDSEAEQARCRDRVVAVYGPFPRKRSRRGFDDERVYVYLRSDGFWVDREGEAPCFVAGTPVATPGGARAIEELREGDAIVSWVSGRSIVARVVRTKRRLARTLTVELADGRRLRASGNQPLYDFTKRAWIEAERLEPGDLLASFDGAALSPIAIARVVPDDGEVEVFDLTVEPSHSYFAGGVWAHNY